MTEPPGEEIRMMNSFAPCFIFWSTALIRALTVASITGAKNLITTGFVAMFYPPPFGLYSIPFLVNLP
jgi:hypothetical protein